jgi:hypothetical protein
MNNPHIRQLLELIKEQNIGLERLIAERDKLREEVGALVGWANGDQDALSCLQRLYSDPSASQTNRIRAASAAIGYEMAKPPSTAVVFSFGDELRRARLEHMAQQREKWLRGDAPATNSLTTSKIIDVQAEDDPNSAA